MSDTAKISIRVIRIQLVILRLGVSRSTIYNWLNKRSRHYRADFPRPFKIGKAAIGWLESDIENFIHSMVSGS